MEGSSWADTGGVGAGSTLSRVFQHALPDDGVTWAENVASGRQLYLEAGASFTNTRALPSKNRNGYVSDAVAEDSYSLRAVTKVAWWNAALGKAQQADPSVGGSPVDYVP